MVKIDIEIPIYCCDCPCCNAENSRCNITGDSTYDKRPFDCPLKEVKHAHWQETKHAHWVNGICTNCGANEPINAVYCKGDIVYQYQGELNYCPNCGFDMRGER